MSSIQVSVMVFTLNEEANLPNCLGSVAWCDDVIVVDSFSTDRTLEICRGAGARLYQRVFDGFGSQRNWALLNTQPKYPWVLILDADERVPSALVSEMAALLNGVSDDVAAFRIRRRFHMWSRWLRHSSLYPSWVVRLVRVGRVQYINRGHAETQEVQGRVLDLENDLIDESLKGIDEWFTRQNRYSTKDAEYEIALEGAPLALGELVIGDPLVRRAALKRLAIRMPARPFLYFVYSFFIRAGFVDGKDGLVFCMMRALYQGMVVAKKHDVRRRMR